FEAGIRPGWQVLGAGLTVCVVDFVRARWHRRGRRPGAAKYGKTVGTFVVAHGAWGAGWVWKKMHPLMAARGHRLITPTYTGLGERSHLANPAIDLDTHISDIVTVLDCEDLTGLMLIGHSDGGMVATGVADRARNRIAKLIYIDA